MTGLLKSKLGVFILTLLVFAVMVVLHRTKANNAAKAEDQKKKEAIQLNVKSTAAEDSTMLKRAEEAARARGESARKERAASKQFSEGYDESGNLYKKRATPLPVESNSSGPPSSSGSVSQQQTAEEVVRPTLRLRGRPPEAASTAKSTTPLKSAGTPSKGEIVAPERPRRFVPFGRLIKAELFMTIESTQEDMPLVGLIVEPVYNNGLLVIPAGTEIHGTARPDRVRNKILSGPNWKMIFPREGSKPAGRMITFEGVALDRDDKDGNGYTWGLTDGSYGLSGRTLRGNQTQEQVMIFAAEAIKAASGTMTSKQQTILGENVVSNMRNAGLSGGQAVLDEISKQIAEEVKKNGVYIQVPAGKQFYIYPRQIIDPDVADLSKNVAKVE